VEDCLDLLTDVLGRFGGYLGAQHGEVGGVVLPYLDGGRATLRKRALHALGEWVCVGEGPGGGGMIEAVDATLRKRALHALGEWLGPRQLRVDQSTGEA
jgi:hypothetical protein